MSSIELRHVTVLGPGGVKLLDDVSLLVPDGTSLAIVGPAGAGKTTLLRTLVGLQDHASGDILIDGTVVNAVDARGRDLAMVFDDHVLHPNLDVLENLAFGASLRRTSDPEGLAQDITDAASLLALTDHLDTEPEALSPAQAQRVAIGRVLVRESHAYLFDDAFTAQSERIRPHVRSVVSQWQTERGRTTIFTTSSIGEALSIADRVAVLHRGVVQQVGPPREVYEEPDDMLIAGFLGSPPMNLVPAFPAGGDLITPLGTVAMDRRLREATEDRNIVVAGIRPEHCVETTADSGDHLVFTTRVDDVEWRGNAQYVYLGYEMEADLEEVLEELEDLLGYDLFQDFLVAAVSPQSHVRAGEQITIGVPRQLVHIFDPETGENLTFPLDDA